MAALREARLYSVGDLVDRAAATPKKISTGEMYVDGTASVYEVLHAMVELSRATALVIGDAIIDAGPLPPTPPPVKPKRTRPKPQTSATVKAVEPVQVPVSEFPLYDANREKAIAEAAAKIAAREQQEAAEQAAKAHAIATARTHSGNNPEPHPLPAGVTVEALMAAYIVHRFDNRKTGSPPTVKPVEFEGRLWVVVGYAGDQTKEYGFRCLPLVPTLTWLDHHSGIPLKDRPRSGMDTHEDYLQFWTGVRVKVGKREFGIDVAGEARVIVTPRSAAPAESPTSTSVGKCRVCGCVESDCQRCVERTGEPCTWTSPAKDLCSACLPLLETDIGVLAMIRGGITQPELSKVLKSGVRMMGQALCLSPDSPAHKLKTELRDDLKTAAEGWIADQLRRTDDGVEMMEESAPVALDERGEPTPGQPICCRCNTPGDVADNPILAAEETDLIPLAMLTIDVLPALNLSATEAMGKHVCCKCLDELEQAAQSKYDQVGSCYRCTKIGHQVVGKPASEASGDDLLLIDDLTRPIADHLGLSPEECEGKLLCLECHGKVLKEIGGKGKKRAQKGG